MDILDKQIIMELSNNCRVSYTYLGQKYQVSSNTIKNRVRILEKRGIIGKFTFEFNPSLLNMNLVLILFRFHTPLNNEQLTQLGVHPLITGIGVGVEAGFATGIYRNHQELSIISDVFNSIGEINEVTIFPVLLPLSADRASPQGSLNDITASDWTILSQLRENGRVSLSELSEKTHISVKTIRKKIQKLQERKMIILTIQLNPGKIARGMMVVFAAELNKLTRQLRIRIENKIRNIRPNHFWVSWQVVDRPIIILAFQAESADEVKLIQDDIRETIPKIKSLTHLVGGSMNYYPDLTDELLKEHVEKKR
ncbi:MAG: AsnC family transcriptional regulator [Candidatus Hodarchaeota archaeon]